MSDEPWTSNTYTYNRIVRSKPVLSFLGLFFLPPHPRTSTTFFSRAAGHGRGLRDVPSSPSTVGLLAEDVAGEASDQPRRPSATSNVMSAASNAIQEFMPTPSMNRRKNLFSYRQLSAWKIRLLWSLAAAGGSWRMKVSLRWIQPISLGHNHDECVVLFTCKTWRLSPST